MIKTLKRQLSEEWNKPKEKNLRRNKKGEIIDSRTPRDYGKIKHIQTQIKTHKRYA